VTKLNLGCGNKKIHGYINIDAIKENNPDDVLDIKNISKKYNNVDIIYACHSLEHFSRVEAQEALADWYSALKPGGTLRIAVPDLEMAFKHYILHGDFSKIKGFLYGGQRNIYDFHKYGYDYLTLSNLLYEIGFNQVYKYDWRKTEHSHIDDYSQAYLPHMDKINGVLMSLNVEAVK